ncbi:ATP-binding protein [Paenisporosarcina indica]|uniref:ATP-binding protein n=1 Tax=Paenisporosarcina indica TaxID=650093 RepID=UPI001FE9BAD3|nr:ATP-binding protein [Paenisporosarcina indica]
MLSPFQIADGVLWDLRRIPFILGLLYVDRKKGMILLSFLLIVRYFIGDILGFYMTVCTFVGMAIIINLIKRFYVRAPLVHKLGISGLLVLVSIQFTFLGASIITDVNLDPLVWLHYLLINFVGILIATLFIEVIKMNSELLEKLVKAEKLEVVSHLAASISHEVRNPLTTCKGFLQLSQNEDIPPEVKSYIGTAIQELDRASEIINDYLTFAKPAPGELEKIFICKEVQQVVNILTPLANMNEIKLLVNVAHREESYIWGDRRKLEQSLINIIKNGIESMPNGGNLEIQTTYADPHVFIKIRDEGEGMTQKQISRLGEPYFTTKENGTGLGMMVSYSLIKGMGGQINVDSEVGNWTTFSIEFPLAEQ